MPAVDKQQSDHDLLIEIHALITRYVAIVEKHDKIILGNGEIGLTAEVKQTSQKVSEITNDIRGVKSSVETLTLAQTIQRHQLDQLIRVGSGIIVSVSGMAGMLAYGIFTHKIILSFVP